MNLGQRGCFGWGELVRDESIAFFLVSCALRPAAAPKKSRAVRSRQWCGLAVDANRSKNLMTNSERYMILLLTKNVPKSVRAERYRTLVRTTSPNC